jgi:signal transduction histidine kinase
VRRLDLLVEKVGRIPPLAVDAAIGIIVFGTGTASVLSSGHNYGLHGELLALPPRDRVEVALLATMAVGLALRRKNIWVAFLLVQLATLVMVLANISYGSEFVAELVILYSVAERSPTAMAVVALLSGLTLDYVSGLRTVPGATLLTAAQFDWAYIGLAWFAGLAQRQRRIIAEKLRQRAAALSDERERLARAAVLAERARIARDLHALVVRGVQQMNRETRFAELELAGGGGRVPGAIAAIETTGRATLGHMRRLLSVLRASSDDAEEPPAALTGSETTDSKLGLDGRSLTARAASRFVTDHPTLRALTRRLALPSVGDALVVLVLGAWAAGEAMGGLGSHPVLTVAILVLEVGVLIFRRTAPVLGLIVIALIVFAGSTLKLDLGPNNTGDRTFLVAVFTVAAERGLPWSIAAIGLQIVAYAPLTAIQGACDVGCQIGWTPVFVFAAIAGLGVRESRQLNHELHEQTEMLRETRKERVRLAVTEERTRVARDLHDVVAHGLTVMVVQAGAARALAESHPERATEALLAVDRTGREAIRELGSLLIDLGPDAIEAGGSLAEPGGHTIESLVEHEVDAGLRVDLRMEGAPGPLDAGVEISLYRIVQEALTNVRKHAPGARARVVIRYHPDGAEVEVTNTAAATSVSRSPVPGSGQGLVGIAERAALFGGEATANSTPDGGFRVRARLLTEPVTV